ncbi:uncharacterized protein LOC120200671 [Hibiscus syriacus]|uniref:uncharacterized protein LOC120200671 n=1 Tax=Hibiscus syriacus TaxID=106335 RepID=UPI0019206070|nr:uncharacterized protein LOC120200671 [Hibiscus syriacus]
MWSVFFVGLVVGVLAVVSLELVGLLFVLNRLNRRIKRESLAASNPQSQPPLDFAYNKQGTVWVLESEKAPTPREQKRKKDSPLEVSPTRKHAKILENNLVFIHSDASRTTTIPLKGCIIEAVSATNLPSRKWTKRFPIRVESKTSPIYNGSKTIYLYLETSWEKASWCQSLRLASFEDKEKLSLFAKLNEDFRAYLASLNAGYPSFMKPSLGFSAEPMDKGGKFDGSSSKVRLFWRKLSKKAIKPGMENKGIWTSQTAREDRKTCEKQHPFQDSVTKKVPNNSTEENMPFPLQQGFPCTVSQSASVASDADSEQEKFSFDEGTLCWNLLISRMFFDIKGNAALKSSIQARIQRTLSNMRTPSYIGEVICTDLDIGNLPPYIHATRLLPTDMNEVWAFEVDAEYSHGILLDVETRLEVSDQDFQKGLVDPSSESSSAENVSSDLLEGFEHFGKHLNLPEEDEVDPKVVKETGQVNLHLMFLSFVQAAIRETMVLPNCESACIPFMLAEKDDWVPRKDAPFIWLNQEAATDNNIEAKENSRKTSSSHPESKNPKPKKDSSRDLGTESEAIPSSSSSAKSRSLQDLRTPLLAIDEPHETHQQNREETSDSVSVSRSLTESERQSNVGDDIDSRSKKTGRRARMMDLTKKMGEKLEEKKRHIEERGRHIVQKMRGP